MQYLLIYVVFERSQKIDDLPISATCWSGTLVMLSSNVNGPVAHGSN